MTICNICSAQEASKTRKDVYVCDTCDCAFSDVDIEDAIGRFNETEGAENLFTFDFSGTQYIGVKVSGNLFDDAMPS